MMQDFLLKNNNGNAPKSFQVVSRALARNTSLFQNVKVRDTQRLQKMDDLSIIDALLSAASQLTTK